MTGALSEDHYTSIKISFHGTALRHTAVIQHAAETAIYPNMFGLFSTAAGPMQAPGSDVRDVQERWIDHREIYDAHERKEWRKEGEMVRDEAANLEAGSKIRERKP